MLTTALPGKRPITFTSAASAPAQEAADTKAAIMRRSLWRDIWAP
jgi:hypothetical protein